MVNRRLAGPVTQGDAGPLPPVLLWTHSPGPCLLRSATPAEQVAALGTLRTLFPQSARPRPRRRRGERRSALLSARRSRARRGWSTINPHPGTDTPAPTRSHGRRGRDEALRSSSHTALPPVGRRYRSRPRVARARSLAIRGRSRVCRSLVVRCRAVRQRSALTLEPSRAQLMDRLPMTVSAIPACSPSASGTTGTTLYAVAGRSRLAFTAHQGQTEASTAGGAAGDKPHLDCSVATPSPHVAVVACRLPCLDLAMFSGQAVRSLLPLRDRCPDCSTPERRLG